MYIQQYVIKFLLLNAHILALEKNQIIKDGNTNSDNPPHSIYYVIGNKEIE